jgi:DNA repair exonuclease SbcCD ATPase subunit
MKLKKIYHIADIHIRNLKRHEEYRMVFNKLFEEIRNRGTENSLIYLGGDIAHAKLEMSPELIREISWLLTECTKLCPTILITGNHDCNMNNLNRIDVLTPIVNALNLPGLIYLRDTQVWNYGGVGFGVFGIFDDKSKWPLANNEFLKSYDKKIALFHGPINSALTDIGYKVENRDYTVDLFDGYDAALCGDIHKRQELVSKTGCKIVYCGSLVQQNYGESVNGHGFLVWDIDTMTYESVDIPNEYSYYTLEIDNGVLKSIPQLPSNSRVRLKVFNTEDTVVKNIVHDIKQKYSIKDVTILPVSQLQSTGNSSNDMKIDSMDLNNIEVQNKILSDYLKKMHGDITEKELSDIFKLNVDINNKIPKEDISARILWKPISFKFSNMFSYGENNEIDFQKIGGLNGIFAPNSSGKSSIFDAVSFCLFDKCSRTSKPINVLNTSATTFDSELLIEIQSERYLIKRVGKLNKKGDTIRVDVDFKKLNSDGTETLLNGDDRRVTNKIIEQYVGKYDDFVLTALSVQGNNAMFIEKTQSERKELLAKFMGLHIYDSLYDVAYHEIYDVNSLMKTFKKTDYSAELIEKEAEFQRNRETFMKLEAEEKEYADKRSVIESQIFDLSSQLKPVSFVGDIDNLSQNKSVLNDKIEKCRIQLVDIDAQTTKFEELVRTLSEQIKTAQFNNSRNCDVEQIVIEYNDKKSKVNKLSNEIDKLKISLSANNDKLSHLEKHEYDPNCKYCVTNVFVQDALKTKEIVQEQRSKLETLESSYVELNDDLNELYSIVQTDYKKYIDLKNEYNSSKSIFDNYQTDKRVTLADYEVSISKLEKITNDIQKYYENESAIQENKKINDKILSLKQDMSGIDLALKGIKSKLQSIISDSGSIKTFIQVTKEKIETVKNLEYKHKIYSMYMGAVNKDGVPYELISKTLPVINAEINNILGQVVDFNVLLDTDGKNINTNIIYDGVDWPLEMACGMEKFISGLAIRTALINVCNLPRPNFLVIDEGMGSLDSDNLSSLYMLFDYLKSQFDFILLISHVDSIRDIVDGLLEIKKINGISSINHV